MDFTAKYVIILDNSGLVEKLVNWMVHIMYT